MNAQAMPSFQAKATQGSVQETRYRQWDMLWRMLVVLLALALASEELDEMPYQLTEDLSVPWPRFMLVFLLMFAVFITSALGRRIRLDIPTVYRPLFWFWCASQLSIIGILWMGIENTKLLQFIKTDVHFTIYVVFVYIVLKLANWERFRFFLRIYYGLGIVAGVIAIMQFVHVNFSWFPWMSNYLFASSFYREVGFRASSFFGEASWAGRYYIHWVALSLAFYSCSQKKRYIAFLSLFGLAFYMASSLLGYTMLLAFAVALLILQMRERVLSVSRGAKVATLLVGDLIVCILLLLILFESSPPIPPLLRTSIHRVGEVLQGAGGVGNRIDGVLAGLKVWQESPLFGVGLGNNLFYIFHFYIDPAFVVRSRFDADSVYVQVLSERGIIGLVAFLYFLLRMIRTPDGNVPRAALAKSWDRRKAYVLLRFLQIDLVAQAVGMLTYSDLLTPHLWVIVAMVLVVQQVVLQGRGMVDVRATVSDEGLKITQKQWSSEYA